MELGLHVVSLHTLVPALLWQVFCHHEDLRGRLLPPTATLDEIVQSHHPSLFLLDTVAVPIELGRLCRVLRMGCPGSKFLALLPPCRSSDEDMVRMLYLGMDSLVVISERISGEIVQAVRATLNGDPWVPRHVLQLYVRQTNQIIDDQFRANLSLTAREQQVFQMMIRRFSNREIASTIGVSLRTVKFHVSNILAKLHVANRHELLHALEVAPSRGQ